MASQSGLRGLPGLQPRRQVATIRLPGEPRSQLRYTRRAARLPLVCDRDKIAAPGALYICSVVPPQTRSSGAPLLQTIGRTSQASQTRRPKRPQNDWIPIADRVRRASGFLQTDLSKAPRPQAAARDRIPPAGALPIGLCLWGQFTSGRPSGHCRRPEHQGTVMLLLALCR